MKTSHTSFVIALTGLALAACAQTQTKIPLGETSEIIAYQEGVPGGSHLETLLLEGVVSAVNAEARTLKVVLKDGRSLTVAPRPEAVNFEQVAVGDLVKAEFSRKVEFGMAVAGENAEDGSVRVVTRAPEGSVPEGSAIEVTHITAEVQKIDAETRTVTLKFPDGKILKHVAREDIDLSKHKAGDLVAILITETIDVRVTKPTP